jgi:phenylalanine-4-hydroxylase
MGYSPVVRHGDEVRVELAAGHPGYADPAYRARRDAIAARSASWSPGDPVPTIEYTAEEHAVWQTVCRELAPKHERYAVGEMLEASARLALPADRVPQLSEVTALLAGKSGFRYDPVAGLAPLRHFYRSFADRTFYSTQYLRHPSRPLYTPEPDIIHEVVGHATQLASPTLAALYELVGAAVERTSSDEALRFLSHVFWFTFEFGVIREQGELRAIGAGILSSYGELDVFRQAEIRPLDFAEMGARAYDITRYQPVLYAADSFDEFTQATASFLQDYDDHAYQAHVRALVAH